MVAKTATPWRRPLALALAPALCLMTVTVATGQAVPGADCEYAHWLGTEITGRPYGVHPSLVANIVYLADYESGLVTLDVSSPTEPVVLALSGGSLTGIDGDDRYLVACRYGLQGAITIFDAVVPEAPSPIAEIAGIDCSAVELAGGLVLASTAQGLLAIDVTVPSAPAIVDTLDTGAAVAGCVVAGEVAHVIDGTPSLALVSIADPDSLQVLGSLDLPTIPRSIAYHGGVVYIGDEGGFTCYDVADPAEPQPLGSLTCGGHVGDLHVAGELLLVCDLNEGLRLYDVQAPADPVLVGMVGQMNQTQAVTAAGPTVFVADGGLHCLDASVPSTPMFEGALDSTQVDFRGPGLEIVGETAYLADWAEGLVVVDLARPLSPSFVGFVPLPVDDSVLRLAAGGTALYTARNGGGLDVWTLADPHAPAFVVHVDLPRLAGGLACTDSRLAYVADDGIRLLTLDDPLDPLPASVIPVTARGVALDGDRLLGVGGESLGYFDIADPDAPVQLGELALGGRLVGWLGEAACVVGSDELWIVDVTDPGAMVPMASLALPVDMFGSGPVDLAIDGGLILLANSAWGLCVVDASRLDAPRLVGMASPGGTATAVAIMGDYWVVNADHRMVQVAQVDCADIVATLVCDLGAEYANGAVRLAWSLTDPCPADRLRLEARGDGRSWSLAAVADGAGAYSAIDPLRGVAGVTGVDYELQRRPEGQGDGWVALAAIHVDLPSRAAGTPPRLRIQPNPFNPRASLVVDLARPAHVDLRVYDARGMLVATLVDGSLGAGLHEFAWDGRDLRGRAVASGVYHARLEADGRLAQARLTLVR